MKKMTIKNVSLLLVATMASTNLTFAAGNFQYQQNYPQPQPQYQQNYYPQQAQNYAANKPLKGHLVTVPPGISMPAVVSTPISSEFLTIGQPVSVTLGSDFYYNSSLIAPAGSTVMGNVIVVTKAKHGSMNGTLKLRFTEVITPYGTRMPISAVIKTDDGTGLLRGGTKADVAKAYAKDLSVGAGAGALTGLVASAISGGAIGKGTAIMTGVGMAGGLAKSVYDKGVDVIIPSGATVELCIDQPITVNPSANSYDY